MEDTVEQRLQATRLEYHILLTDYNRCFVDGFLGSAKQVQMQDTLIAKEAEYRALINLHSKEAYNRE